MTVGLAACGRTATGFGQLITTGRAQITPAHGRAHAGHNGDVLRAGDVLQVTSGQTSIDLVPNGVLQLRAGSRLLISSTPQLASGAVLIQPAGRTLRVSADRATLVVPSGAAQLSVGSAATGVVAKVYESVSRLEIANNPSATIAAPRQIDLTSETRLPVEASPLQYQSGDPWDHQYLAEAETISMQLAAVAAGFNAQVPANQGGSPAFYQQLVPTLSGRADFVAAFDSIEQEQPDGLSASQPGAYLIASVIALRGTDGSFANRLSDELTFFGQGAPWGFVAFDQGVTDLTGVLNDVLAAVGRATLPFTGSTPSQIAIGPPPTTSAPPTTVHSHATTPTTVPRTTPTTTPSGSGQPRSPTTTTTSPPLIKLPVPVIQGPLGSLLNPLLDPLIQALNNILAGKL